MDESVIICPQLPRESGLLAKDRSGVIRCCINKSSLETDRAAFAKELPKLKFIRIAAAAAFGAGGWLWPPRLPNGWLWPPRPPNGWLWLPMLPNGWLWLPALPCLGWLWLPMLPSGWLWLSTLSWLTLSDSTWAAGGIRRKDEGESKWNWNFN